MKRYQFVWYGWSESVWQPHRNAYVGCIATVYEWWISLGPLEIRKWKARP